MKNIELEQVEQYNHNYENRHLLDKYMQVNIAHLQDDIRKCEKNKNVGVYNQLDTLMKKCSEIHLRVLRREELEQKHFEMLREINNYNTAKNKELGLIGVLTVVLLIVAVLMAFFLK